MPTILAEQLRQDIIILKNRDPQYNLTILENKDGKVKVEINWSVGDVEILEITLKDYK